MFWVYSLVTVKDDKTNSKTKGTDLMKKLVTLLLTLIMVLTLTAAAFAAPTEKMIGEEAAKVIALEHAGYDEADVKFFRARLDFDDGRYEYEIEFRTADYFEYDYTIDAASGKIVDFDKDYEAPARVEFLRFVEFLKTFFKRLFG